MSDALENDIFLLNGRVRPDIIDGPTEHVLRESLAQARATNWESVRTPHLFMGLLATPESGVFDWAKRLGADIGQLLEQFRELFYQNAEPLPPLLLNREFLSDNVIRVLRDAYQRAVIQGRSEFNQMDLLITLFTYPNSIVVECFERIGVAGTRLADLAMLAEQEMQY